MNDDKLFFSVWRNIFLKSNILSHLKLYKENETVKIYTIKQLEEYKYRSYILKLEIHPNEPLEPEGIIPNQVFELKFSFKFNQLIKKDMIPNSVKSIRFLNFNYDRPIEKDVLPEDLEYLKINGEDTEIEFGSNRVLPNNLRELEIYSFYQFIPPNSMPSNLKVLKIYLEDYEKNPHQLVEGSLPHSLQVLRFDGLDQDLDSSILPKTITDLNLRDFDRIIKPNDFPNLKKLSLYSFCQPLEKGQLPEGLEELKFGFFNHPLKEGDLPSSIKILKLGTDYNYPIIENTLPSSLESLYLSSHFNHPLEPNVIPNSVKFIDLGHYFNCTLQVGSIPSSVTQIKINYYYDKEILPNVLPSSLIHIQFRNSDMESLIDQSLIPSGATVIYGDDEDETESNSDILDEDDPYY